MWEIAIWSKLEPTLGITCACIPLLRPILDRFILRRKETMIVAWPSRQISRQYTYSHGPIMFPTTDDLALTESAFRVPDSQGIAEMGDGKDGGVPVKGTGRFPICTWIVIYRDDLYYVSQEF